MILPTFQFPKEQETLLPIGTKFKVTGIETLRNYERQGIMHPVYHKINLKEIKPSILDRLKSLSKKSSLGNQNE